MNASTRLLILLVLAATVTNARGFCFLNCKKGDNLDIIHANMINEQKQPQITNSFNEKIQSQTTNPINEPSQPQTLTQTTQTSFL